MTDEKDAKEYCKMLDHPDLDAYRAALSKALDELNSREEFLAKPALLSRSPMYPPYGANNDPPDEERDGEPLTVLTAKLFDSDDGDRRWEDLDLMNEKGTRVWSTGITPATGGSVGAEERATDYAHSVHAEIDWKPLKEGKK